MADVLSLVALAKSRVEQRGSPVGVIILGLAMVAIAIGNYFFFSRHRPGKWLDAREVRLWRVLRAPRWYISLRTPRTMMIFISGCGVVIVLLGLWDLLTS